eukprot:scaffold265105_cov44-Tisochrysis_lutea.AAC.2
MTQKSGGARCTPHTAAAAQGPGCRKGAQGLQALAHLSPRSEGRGKPRAAHPRGARHSLQSS